MLYVRSRVFYFEFLKILSFLSHVVFSLTIEWTPRGEGFPTLVCKGIQHAKEVMGPTILDLKNHLS